MRALKLLFMLSVIFAAVPVRADDTATTENTGAQAPADRSERAARPQREAVKLSPSVRQSAPRPDETGKMKRQAPPRAEAPLQNVPALMEPPPGVETPTK